MFIAPTTVLVRKSPRCMIGVHRYVPPQQSMAPQQLEGYPACTELCMLLSTSYMVKKVKVKQYAEELR